jgi:hypothetical protein
MYIFAQHGIFSIVAHQDKCGMLMVRSPVRDDLEHYWPAAKIVRTDERDYLFRTTLPREVVAQQIAEVIAKIDYTNVKDSVSNDRHLAYFNVWSIIMDLQADLEVAEPTIA